MLSNTKNNLFTEVSFEESATVSGGGPLSYLTYILLAGTPASPGGTTVNDAEIAFGWNILINQSPAVGGVVTP
jgi:hypothetical protein